MTPATGRNVRRRDPVAIAATLLAGALAFQSLGGVVPCTPCVEQRWSIPEACAAAGRPAGVSGTHLLETMIRTPFVRCDRPQWTMPGPSLADAIVSDLTVLGIAITMPSTTVRKGKKASEDDGHTRGR